MVCGSEKMVTHSCIPDGTWERVYGIQSPGGKPTGARQDITSYRRSGIPDRMGWVEASTPDWIHPGVGFSYDWQPIRAPGLVLQSDSRSDKYSYSIPDTTSSGSGVILSMGYENIRNSMRRDT